MLRVRLRVRLRLRLRLRLRVRYEWRGMQEMKEGTSPCLENIPHLDPILPLFSPIQLTPHSF